MLCSVRTNLILGNLNTSSLRNSRDVPQAPRGRWHGLEGNWETCGRCHFDKSCCVHDLSLSPGPLFIVLLWIETTDPCRWAKGFSRWWQHRLNENKQRFNKYTISTWPNSHLLKNLSPKDFYCTSSSKNVIHNQLSAHTTPVLSTTSCSCSLSLPSHSWSASPPPPLLGHPRFLPRVFCALNHILPKRFF